MESVNVLTSSLIDLGVSSQSAAVMSFDMDYGYGLDPVNTYPAIVCSTFKIILFAERWDTVACHKNTLDDVTQLCIYII